MLFDYHRFDPIVRGEITLTFRDWSRPQAKASARHRLDARGVIVIESVDRVRVGAISRADLRRAGFSDKAELMSAVRRRKGDAAPDELYRVAFHFEAEVDPREGLARDRRLSDSDCAAIAEKLDRMDARSAHGAWTRETLRLIDEQPRVLASRLAAQVKRERLAFKLDVRKLKALGLTISHEIGYEISPRGRAFMAWERRRKK
jgi:hypothetical protein